MQLKPIEAQPCRMIAFESKSTSTSTSTSNFDDDFQLQDMASNISLALALPSMRLDLGPFCCGIL